MTPMLKFISAILMWVTTITGLHLWLNSDVFDRQANSENKTKFRVGFLPVTCHLTCPVTHFINESSTGDGIFEPVRFQ